MSSRRKSEIAADSEQEEAFVQKMKSVFKCPDVILVVDGEELYVEKSELIEKSPVFKAMFSSPFKEKDSKRIELPGKNMKHFLIFLRCMLSGINDVIDMTNVYDVVPLAHEYQVDSILSTAQMLLSERYTRYGSMQAQQIVNDIVFAESYNLNTFLETLVDFASKKWLQYLRAATEFDKISHAVLHKIAMKRWNDNVEPKSCDCYRGYPNGDAT